MFIEDVTPNYMVKAKTTLHAATCSYKPTQRGEAASLMELCQTHNIMAKYTYGWVRIFSKIKIPLFHELIKENLTLQKERKSIFGHLEKWSGTNHQVFCVGVKKEEKLYTFEAAVPRVVVGQFRGVIPVVGSMMVCNTREDMVNTLLKKGVII